MVLGLAQFLWGAASMGPSQQGAKQVNAWTLVAVLTAVFHSSGSQPVSLPVLPQVVTKVEGHCQGALHSSPLLC